MMKYEKYKSVEVSWIKQIPTEWRLQRTTDRCVQNKNLNKSLSETNLLSLSYGKLIKKDIYTVTGLLPNSFDNYQIIEPGHIILRLTDLQNDKKSLRVGYCYEKGIITSAYLGLKFDRNVETRYIFYLLYSYDINKIFYSQGGSMRQSMKFDDFKTIPLLVPPKSEQTAIANYLDQKTTTIDKKTELLQQKIETYKKLRKAIINKAVTKGLDNKVDLKESEIDWIGKIPKHWEVKRVKDVLSKNDGGVWGDFVDDLSEGKIVLRSTEIRLDGKWDIKNPAICALNEKEFLNSHLKKGDLLLTKSSGSENHIGKTAYVDDFVENLECAYSNFMQRLRVNSVTESKFLFWVLNSYIARIQFKIFSKSTTGLGNLSADIINFLIILFPPIKEQRQIAEYLDQKTATIDKIVENLQTQIATLQHLRKVLINDAVTGKIKVV